MKPVMRSLSPREHEALAAWQATGTLKGVAAALGVGQTHAGQMIIHCEQKLRVHRDALRDWPGEDAA